MKLDFLWQDITFTRWLIQFCSLIITGNPSKWLWEGKHTPMSTFYYPIQIADVLDLNDYFNPSSPNGVGCKKHTDNKLQIVSVLPSLNTQSCIKGLLVVRDFSFGPFGQPGQYWKKHFGLIISNYWEWFFSCFHGQKLLFF